MAWASLPVNRDGFTPFLNVLKTTPRTNSLKLSPIYTVPGIRFPKSYSFPFFFLASTWRLHPEAIGLVPRARVTHRPVVAVGALPVARVCCSRWQVAVAGCWRFGEAAVVFLHVFCFPLIWQVGLTTCFSIWTRVARVFGLARSWRISLVSFSV